MQHELNQVTEEPVFCCCYFFNQLVIVVLSSNVYGACVVLLKKSSLMKIAEITLLLFVKADGYYLSNVRGIWCVCV